MSRGRDDIAAQLNERNSAYASTVRALENQAKALKSIEAQSGAFINKEAVRISQLSRQIDAALTLSRPSVAERAIRELAAYDRAREAVGLGRPFIDPISINPPDFGISATSALAGLKQGALQHEFEMLPQWMLSTETATRELLELSRSSENLLGYDAARYQDQFVNFTRLFVSTHNVARMMQDMQRQWEQLASPAMEVVKAWQSVEGLSTSADRLWAEFAATPARLAHITPALARAPGLEVYTAARAATALIALEDNAFVVEEVPEAEVEITLISDSFDARLKAFDPALFVMYCGGVERVEEGGPDWIRQALISFRELTMHLVHALAPDAAVKRWAQPEHYANDKLTRRARLEYIFRNVDGGDFSEFMQTDYTAAVQLLELLNKVHKKTPQITAQQIRVLRNRIQGFVSTLLEAAGH